MKHIRTVLLIIFTLALFAGVFFEVYAYAAPSEEPWNVVAVVVCGSRQATYNLKSALPCANEQNRGVFLGEKGKRQLFDQLRAQNLPYDAVFEYILPGFSRLVQNFDAVNVKKRDATLIFDANGFRYFEGKDGVSVDKTALFNALLKSRGKKITINLPLSHEKAITVSDLRKITVKKGSFTTYYASSGENRCHNVAKATASLNGLTVNAGETFSFNAVVGKRTAENGYKQSKVILDGNYVDGVGGGVCQVSTTLYNALLLSEIVPRACQHSLISSYVMPGFDAMVSDSGADLSFVNETGSPLYISAHADKKLKCVTFSLYGVPNLYTVVRENEEMRTPFSTVEIVDKQKFPQLVYTDQTKVLVCGSDGVKTKSYLCFYREDKLVCRKLIRQNVYKRVDEVVARGYVQREEAANAP